MKTIHTIHIPTGLMIIFSIFMRPAGATGNLEVNTLENEKTVRMELNTPAEGEINLTLYDQSDRIYYSDRIASGATFNDEIDFSTVRKGTYRLVSELGNMRYNRIYRVGENSVEFQESYNSFTPQFKVEEDRLLVHLIKNPEVTVGISIEDEYGHVFNAFYEDPGVTFNKVYGLDGLERGSYVIHLMSDRELFSFEFKVE